MVYGTLQPMQRSVRKHLGTAQATVKKHWKEVLVWGFGALFLLAGLLLLWTATLKIPDLSSLQNRRVTQSLKIYDRTGKTVLYDINKDVDRTDVTLPEVSPYIQQATISMEDPTFYKNSGVEPWAIVRALLIDIFTFNKAQGGSTLTQQVVKQTILSGDRTITRKLKEVVLAIKLTRELPKDKILEIYLNQAPYGGSVYGVEEACQRFFGKHAGDVTLAQAAYLGAILPAPSYYSPYGNNKAILDTLQKVTLDKMATQGYITVEQRDAAKAEVVTFLPPRPTAIQAPHFVFYVEQYLEQKYGQTTLDEGGWSVVTTLDADLQAKAEEIAKKDTPDMQKNYNASNAGIIALDPNSGQILAMVGSRNYFDTQIDGNFNITLAHRQPGSTFKPIAYAEAFLKGYTPDTVLFDVPTQFSTNCQPDDFTMGGADNCYSPGDFDDKWRGPMSLRDALAQSINIPAVETLYLAGINDTLSLAKSMGIQALGPATQYGLTLVLGGGEVSLLEMTSAYSTFATGGTHYPTTAILKITDKDGNTVEDNSQQTGATVLPPAVTQQINDVLSDNVARTPEFGANSALYFPGRDVAVKTGTTNDYKDAWVIGYTPNVVVGSWAGNNNNSPMTKNIAGFILAPMWHEVMQYALTKTPTVSFAKLDTSTDGGKPILRGTWQGGDSVIVDSRTGTAATLATPSQYLLEEVPCNIHNILYWVNKDNIAAPTPGAGSTDSQYPYWEKALQTWLAKNPDHSCKPGVMIPVGAVSSLTPAATSTGTTTQGN